VLIVDYASDCGTLQNRLVTAKPHGMTALLDAIPLAVQHLRKAAHPRRAILMISDGGENASRVRFQDVRRQAREANAQIYSATLGLETEFDRGPYPDGLRGPELLREIAGMTGGRAFSIEGHRRIDDAAAEIARELHEQYVIGYESPDTSHDGQHHRISVKVRREGNSPRLSLFYRTGYQAPKE
jgi:VWFA-related protein